MRKRLALLAIAGAVPALLAVGGGTAGAAPCGSAGILGGGPSAWFADEGGGFADAALFTQTGADRYRDDAFDVYGEVELEGVAYEVPNENGCTPSRDRSEIKFAADELGGVFIKPRIYASERKPLARLFVSLRNSSDTPVTFDFAWDGQVGSVSPQVGTSSNGDGAMTQADRWATSCVDFDLDGCGDTQGEAERDPEIAHVWEGKGPKRHSADSVGDLTPGNFEARFAFDDVTVGAGKTVTFLHAVTLAPTIQAANRAARAVDRNPRKAGIFAKLSRRDLRRLQNW